MEFTAKVLVLRLSPVPTRKPRLDVCSVDVPIVLFTSSVLRFILLPLNARLLTVDTLTVFTFRVVTVRDAIFSELTCRMDALK